MSLTEQERICPICGQDNNCQHGKESCWCEKVSFPKELLEMVPKEKRGKACICSSCLEKFNKK